MFEKMIDNITQKTVHKSAKTVKKEVKKKVNEATTGKNGQKLLIAAVIMSTVAVILGLARSNRPVIVNVYNNPITA